MTDRDARGRPEIDQGRSAAVERAVGRHPAAAPRRRDLMDLAVRFLATMHREMVPWPAVAAAALAARGARGLSRSAFSVHLGIDPDHLAAVEAGRCAPAEVALPLRRSAPYVALLAGLERGPASVVLRPEDRPP